MAPLPNQCERGPNIFLIGPRATGKTSVARILAHRLGWEWADADLVFESRHGSIRDAFAREGEADFREKEAEIFADLCGLHRYVIATGGGVVLREDNRARLRSAGWVVWLTADPRTISARLHGDPATADRRPALTDLGGLAEVEKVLQQREPLYRACADVVVDTTGRSVVEVVDEVLALRKAN